jgi:hypothetical protein
MAFIVAFMWFWDEREKERGEVTADQERRRENGRETFAGCLCCLSFATEHKKKCAHPQTDGMKLFVPCGESRDMVCWVDPTFTL